MEETVTPFGVTDIAPAGAIIKSVEDTIPEVQLYPEYESSKRGPAFEAFMRGNSVTQIAVDMNLDSRTVKRWAAKGKWIERLEEQRAVECYEERRKLEQFRREKREIELPAQYAALSRMQDLVMTMVSAAESGGLRMTFDGSKKMAEALKSILDAKSRIIGMNESGATTEQIEKLTESPNSGKRPMIAVIIGNTGAPLGRVVQMKDAIEAQEIKSE